MNHHQSRGVCGQETSLNTKKITFRLRGKRITDKPQSVKELPVGTPAFDALRPIGYGIDAEGSFGNRYEIGERSQES